MPDREKGEGKNTMKIIETRYHEPTAKKPTPRITVAYATEVGKRGKKTSYPVDPSIPPQAMSDMAVSMFVASQEDETVTNWHRTAGTTHGGWVYVSETVLVNTDHSRVEGVTLDQEMQALGAE